MGRLVCFTDDDAGLDDIAEALSLPTTAMKAWWLKAYLFSSEADLTGPVLYLDLDTVVCGDLENLAALASGSRFATLGTAAMRNENRDHGYNSSVMAWTAPLYSEIWALLNEPGAYEVITNCVYKFDHWLEMVIEDARLVDGGGRGALLRRQNRSGALKQRSSLPASPKPHQARRRGFSAATGSNFGARPPSRCRRGDACPAPSSAHTVGGPSGREPPSPPSVSSEATRRHEDREQDGRRNPNAPLSLLDSHCPAPPLSKERSKPLLSKLNSRPCHLL